MYPTAIAGLVLVLAAFKYAAQPDARRRQVVRALGVLTFLIACLGFVSGMIRSFQHAADADVGNLVVVGVGESLVNIAFGLVLLVIAGIATAIGVYRCGPPGASGAGAADLHGI